MQNFLQTLQIKPQRNQLDFVSSVFGEGDGGFYPFLTLAKLMPNAEEGLCIKFAPITIFSGSNGTGKSTLLNIIAELLEAKRSAPFNNSRFFKAFLNGNEKYSPFASVTFEKNETHLGYYQR